MARWHDGAGHPHRSWHWTCSSRVRAAREPESLVPWDSPSSSPASRPGRNPDKVWPGHCHGMFLGRRVYGVSPGQRACALEPELCVPGLSPSTLIAPRGLEWGQWADRSPADCRRRYCVDQTAPSPASWDLFSPCIQPQCLAQDEHQGPISASRQLIAVSSSSRCSFGLCWLGPRPRNEHTFIMRAKLNQPPWSPTPPTPPPPVTCPSGAGAELSNRGSGWLDWLTGQNGFHMNGVGGCTALSTVQFV